jgi:hypothetical protein
MSRCLNIFVAGGLSVWLKIKPGSHNLAVVYADGTLWSMGKDISDVKVRQTQFWYHRFEIVTVSTQPVKPDDCCLGSVLRFDAYVF